MDYKYGLINSKIIKYSKVKDFKTDLCDLISSSSDM